MNRAYSLLQIKSLDDDQRVVHGIATTPSTDRTDDIVEPKGGKFALPLPLLWQHDKHQPIGHVTSAKVTDKGIEIVAQLANVTEPGKLKDRLDEAWQSLKHGLVRGLSIGFRPLGEPEPIKGSWGIHYKEWEWLELSAVTIPANADASIHAVKQFDTDDGAGSGTTPPKVSTPPVGGSREPVKLIQPKAKENMTATERVGALEASIAAKVARLNEIDTTVSKDARAKNEQERQEFDNLRAEISTLNQELKDARDLEEVNKSLAKPVTSATLSTDGASNTRDTARTEVRVGTPGDQKGLAFARYVMSLVTCKNNNYTVIEQAKQRWGDQGGEVAEIAKAAVAAGTTTDSTWAAPLAAATPLNEFLEMLRASTLLGRIPGLRRVPFNVTMPAQTAGGTYSWVGEGSAKPVTKLDTSTVTLRWAKAAGIIVISQELARHSSPSAQETVRNELREGMQRYLDAQFVDSTVAAVANVSPASITNGVAGTAASGTTEAAARADLRALLATFATNNFGLDGVVLLMGENVAFTLGTVVNSLGQTAFPGLNITGGSLLGIPVITSNVMTNQIVAVHAPSILYADEGGVQIDASTEASIQMDSAPTNPTDATTVMVSMFQRNLIALRAEREITWVKARANSVQRITGVAYA